jgi:hypothetical protein
MAADPPNELDVGSLPLRFPFMFVYHLRGIGLQCELPDVTQA